MPLTVALDARLFTRSMTGDTSYWRGLIRALIPISADVRLLLYSNSPKPAEIPESSNVVWIQLEGADRWWSLVRFPLAARKAGARVIHTQYNLSPLAGRNGVTTFHDVSFFIGPEWFRPKDRFLLRWQVPASARRAAKIIAVSQTCKEEIERFVPAAVGKVEVTYNALGENITPMAITEAKEIVQELGVPDDYLLTVGTQWPRKNMGLAIESARLAGRNIVVTGKTGWGGQPVGPIYPGYVTDRQLTALYQCAGLYLAPSFHEGFGIPLLEAFACSCPVLCSAGGALPEVAGGAAEVMSSFEPSAWTERIKSLLADSSKLQHMRQLGVERVKCFDWATTARQTLDIYREAAK